MTMNSSVARLTPPTPCYVVTVEIGRSKIVTERHATNAAAAIAQAVVELREGASLRITARRKQP